VKIRPFFSRLSLSFCCFATAILQAGEASQNVSRINKAIAETPKGVSISIDMTGRAMDGGSILNNLRFSDGRAYRLQLDFPLSLATGKVVSPQLQFRVFVTADATHNEALERGSPAERRLIELLHNLIGHTDDPHEKKNAASLVKFLTDRNQPFPTVTAGYWDPINEFSYR
jgi:hypothetical protein